MKMGLKYLYITLLVVVSGCQRQEIESPNLFLAYVPISIDWTESNMPDGYVANVTAYCYPKGGSSPYKQISGDINLVVMELPIGEYSVIVINDVVGNVGGVEHLDESSYDNFRIEAIVNTSSVYTNLYYTPEDGDNILYEHDRAASWSLDSFTVTLDMVEYTRSEEFTKILSSVRSGETTLSKSLSSTRGDTKAVVTESLEQFVDVQPLPATSVVTIKVAIDNINSAQSISGSLKGFANGAYLASRTMTTLNEGTNIYQFKFTDVEYVTRAETTDGITSCSFNTFGPNSEIVDEGDGEGGYTLQLDVILDTGVLQSYEMDVTEEVLNATSGSTLVTELELELTSEEDIIELPVSSGEGFGVGSWGESEKVVLN